jgi:TATA-box binding protein (TBP) (component of TFIID and TFIIIB)
MEPTNIKISFKIQTVSLSTVQESCCSLGYKLKRFDNFLVVRLHSANKEGPNWVCTVFKKNLLGGVPQHVNVTNIKSFCEVELAVSYLASLNLIALPGTVSIDNVTGLMQVGELILYEVINYIQTNKNKVCKGLSLKFPGLHTLSVHYNNERFPGLFIKFKKNNSKFGTAIVFHSGKIVIIGCKHLSQLRWIARAVSVLISIK